MSNELPTPRDYLVEAINLGNLEYVKTLVEGGEVPTSGIRASCVKLNMWVGMTQFVDPDHYKSKIMRKYIEILDYLRDYLDDPSIGESWH